MNARPEHGGKAGPGPTPRRSSRAGRTIGLAALPLRLIVGYGFFAHGLAKIERGPGLFVEILRDIGLPSPDWLAWTTIGVELIGGLAILSGAFVRWVSLPMAVILLVATFTVHLPNGFSSIKLEAMTPAGARFGQPGYETDLLYLACLAALVIGGTDAYAVDAWRAARRARRSATRPL